MATAAVNGTQLCDGANVKKSACEGGAMWNRIPKDKNRLGESFSPETTHIGKSIAVKGEVSGSENVYVAGELEGSVELIEGDLTIGPEGRIRADVQARSIVVHGRADGNLYGTKRVDLKNSAVLVGDIHTPRIAIEEGASLKGSVLVQRDIPPAPSRRRSKAPRSVKLRRSRLSNSPPRKVLGEHVRIAHDGREWPASVI